MISRDRFLAIFLEEGLDEEWAEICWDRMIKANNIYPTEAEARAEAKDWKDNGSWGF